MCGGGGGACVLVVFIYPLELAQSPSNLYCQYVCTYVRIYAYEAGYTYINVARVIYILCLCVCVCVDPSYPQLIPQPPPQTITITHPLPQLIPHLSKIPPNQVDDPHVSLWDVMAHHSPSSGGGASTTMMTGARATRSGLPVASLSWQPSQALIFGR